MLRQSRVLGALSAAELGQLATLRRRARRAFRRGEVVFHQGDPGDTLHVVLSGRVKVVLVAKASDIARPRTLSDGGPITPVCAAEPALS
ncbi:MAG: cyclic nucleotide-binding domain-containing protein [Chloroflexi bacterium]|nr:MAG: cyclic nucleotide-binding domain-containing protein [Chloroflexota bacterium]